jgi:rhamnosyl/mannosyltransferase
MNQIGLQHEVARGALTMRRGASSAARRPRILQLGKFYPPHRGGIETHLKWLCEGLKSSVDLRVIVANGGARSKTEVINGVAVEREARIMNFAAAPICPGMPAGIARACADLVHLHYPNPAAILAYLASGHKGPVVVTWHSDIVRQVMLGRLFEPILKVFLRRCAAIIASSPDYIESSTILSSFREKCRVVPFGLPLKAFSRVDRHAVTAIRETFGPRIALTAGRLVYYKGIEFLIDAMTRVDATLLIVGNGPLREKLERRAAAAGVAGRVRVLGEVDDLLPYYHACDVFVLPSIARSEAFGIVQLEALACGKPVVNTKLDSGVTFVSPHMTTGLTVPPEDSIALAGAINTLFQDSQMRTRMGEAGLRRVNEHFTVELMTSRTLGLYEEILGTSRNPSRGRDRGKKSGGLLRPGDV